MDSNMTYKFLSRFYDLFDLIFLLGGEGNPRLGLLDAISNTPQRILDVCVGTATSSILVASHNAKNHILGIDISDDMLAVARRKIAQKRLTNLEVQNMSATAMQFADDSFDVVMVSFALHEFKRELRGEIFLEVLRVLKPGGMFCVVDFARESSRLNRVFMKVWTIIEPPCFADFLSMDWHVCLKPYGFCFEGERAFSFSKLYILRKE
jgi:demethylmenaquinone methyltransferase/2-methoxy-6-polyprenyl-1,4-benzoquinol methylase